MLSVQRRTALTPSASRRARAPAGRRALLAPPLLGALLAVVASCTTSPVEWRVRFVNNGDRIAAHVVEARVRRQTCDGEIVWQGTIAQGRALEGMAVPGLAPGQYALDVAARDAGCRTLASACSLVTAPFRGRIVVELPSRPVPALCLPASCDEGTCDCSMGGCADAGPPDAGPLDGGPPDAFVPPDAWTPDDVGPTDAFVAPDAYITPPAAPDVIAPWNGVSTGAPVAASPLVDPPLRPEFIWTAVPGAGSYLVELTRCDSGDWRACSLTTPTYVELVSGSTTRARPSIDLPVATTTPVGARYVFRVGACTTPDHRGCAYSAPRYLLVGRSATDIDGDGTGDLLAVASSASDAILYDVELDASGPAVMRALITQPALGPVTIVGDYDGDGRAEVAVGARESAASGGRWLFLDNLPSGGLTVGGMDASPVSSARLAERIVRLGDVDGDGFADFAVTAPGLGVVRVQYGGSTFEAANRTEVLRPDLLDEFGLDVCAPGDLDGDGRADLAILVRDVGETVTAQVRIYTQRDALMRVFREVPSLIVRTATGFAEFAPDGWKYLELECGGDVDGDGYPDIVLGLHRESALKVDTGVGPVLGFDSTMDDALGWRLGVGDLDGTGRLSVVASRDGYPPGSGARPGGTSRARADGTLRLSVVDIDTSFGLLSAGSDYDGDGRDDVVILSGADLRVHLEDDASIVVVPPPASRAWGAVAN